MRKIFALSILSFILISCGNSTAQFELEQAFPNLSFQQPVDIQNSGDATNRIFVVEQKGIISVISNDPKVVSKKTFLDLTDKVASGGEMGLLGLAFHPNYKSNGLFFVNYTVSSPSRKTIISRFKISDDPDKADKSSEMILMQIDQPYSNHNGGQTSFGPDGYLYISLGDGGSGGDPQNNAQNLKSLLGKILRIDIDKSDPGRNYSIPLDNPFKGNVDGYREEIYAYGLRNVWRFSFDSITKQLWAADVGQNAWEEINVIEKGGNYGWRCFEGFHSYNMNGCGVGNYKVPVYEYGHDSNGGYSITGGFVYRGVKVPELYGKYIYADFVSSNIWALEYKDGKYISNRLFTNAHPVSTFGLDEFNELYFTNYNSGKIYKIKATVTSGTGKAEIPKHFKLFQNFPNPFNPKTVISYKIAPLNLPKGETSVHVTLKVNDVLGREIATIVDEHKQPGVYNSTFNTLRSSLTSGVYFYALKAGLFTETKKMILLK